MNYPPHNKGFTLVETLVATFVLVTAIVAPLTMVSRGIFFSTYSREQITASYLAQEAVESVRNLRDKTTLEGNSWAVFKSSVINPCLVDQNQYGCTIDISNGAIGACTASGCPRLNLNSVSGLYGYQTGGAWTATPYERRIKVYNEPLSDPLANELRVEVQLLWSQGAISKNFIARENLLNWQ